MEDARQRDIIDVVPRRLRIGAELPPAGHAAVDELRIVSEQHVRAEPEPFHHAGTITPDDPRSEERRVGKGWVVTFSYWWAPNHYTKKYEQTREIPNRIK